MGIDEFVPDEQAGFRAKRSCAEQVFTLTSHITSSQVLDSREIWKLGVVFIDLTAAYDTVW